MFIFEEKMKVNRLEVIIKEMKEILLGRFIVVYLIVRKIN